MPELPEVETVRRTLKNFVQNEMIDSVELRYQKTIDGDAKAFCEQVAHQHINDIDRYGKYLIFNLDDAAFLSHLRMEGKYNIVAGEKPYEKHDHVIFHLSNGQDLRYNDTRKFGRMKLVDPVNYRILPPFDELGDEPWDADSEMIYKKIHHSKRTVKQILLDQSILCGIGNIYANEILFRMHLDPRTRASRLSRNRVVQMVQVASDVLNEAIEQGGTTINTFDANGIHGLFQVKLFVHGQKECKVCGHPIRKIVVGGRGTYFCPKCQNRRY
ncbi:MAG: DNA-formamidopyrimidine glycosylase [Erysipelotrichaceae bacterium]|nr:DNA-formamidopyrimidine glycosylase [Erysipelotrichaceae bacterium]